jgi:uroporphyrinogen decarboxylase
MIDNIVNPVTKNLSSRQRVWLALNHKEPDRIPIDFGGQHTSIHQDGHRILKKYLGFNDSDEAPVIDQFQMIVDPDKRIKDLFGVDVISFFANAGSNWDLIIDPVTDIWTDEWGTSYRRPKNGYWYDYYSFPLKKGTIEELKEFKWPDPYDKNRIKGLRKKASDLFTNTDKALLIHNATGGLFETSHGLRGMENLLMEMASSIGFVENLAERVLEFQMGFWDNILSEIGDLVQVVQIGDDLGSMDGLIFSPKVYRQVYKPRRKKLIEFIRTKTDAKVYFHTCGAMRELIPDLIEEGVQILNPVQVSAKNMDSNSLKKEFGKDLVFWGGGADATKVLMFADVDGIREEVKRRIHDLAPGGGFVFASIHNIQPNVPPQNIEAMFSSALEFGNYPITV